MQTAVIATSCLSVRPSVCLLPCIRRIHKDMWMIMRYGSGTVWVVCACVVRRRVRSGRGSSESRSPTADAVTDRRVLRRRRRRSQFATAAAAALQAAVSRAAAAAAVASARPRFSRPTPLPVRPVVKPEQDTEPSHSQRADETRHVDLQANMRDRGAEHDHQQTLSTSGSLRLHATPTFVQLSQSRFRLP